MTHPVCSCVYNFREENVNIPGVVPFKEKNGCGVVGAGAMSSSDPELSVGISSLFKLSSCCHRVPVSTSVADRAISRSGEGVVPCRLIVAWNFSLRTGRDSWVLRIDILL